MYTDSSSAYEIISDILTSLNQNLGYCFFLKHILVRLCTCQEYNFLLKLLNIASLCVLTYGINKYCGRELPIGFFFKQNPLTLLVEAVEMDQ
jgi:hypothetical protein